MDGPTMLMSEAEWLTCFEPRKMLEHLGGRVSLRKRCLFACACVRRVWPLLTHKRQRAAIELAERFADGSASTRELRAAGKIVASLCQTLERTWRRRWAAGPTEEGWQAFADLSAARAVEAALRQEPSSDTPNLLVQVRAARAAVRAAEALREERLGGPAPPSAGEPGRLEALEVADLVRCLFGNPFRPVTPSPDWSAWNRGTVAKVAWTIYDERRFRELPVLADALEEAGCQEEEVLAHCRAAVEHVRGCWVLDALLGLR
jgi:hypothetical protein